MRQRRAAEPYQELVGFPSLAVREVLRLGGMEPGDVDRLVLHGDSPWMYGWYSRQNLVDSKNSRLISIRQALGKALYQQPTAWNIL